ncbi:MAG TPA: lysophospholipid acyltransferase family protein [Cytophagaceae bacterium]|jgi:KDO2-lipid IV(A) lauroyltransferase|nr:lysophospholipid acyltransferase family protein [Cytophagaceae bacterium]
MAYYLTLPFLYLISILPFSILYLISDFLYVIFYYLIGYRKKVVLENLRKSFPDKSPEEINFICKKFYHYFCDLILESLKTLTISKKNVKKHVIFSKEAEGIFKHYYDKKQSIVIVMGHMGNWELTGAGFSQFSFHQLNILYHPLTNKRFDQLVYHMRTRLGNGLYAMNEALRGMLRDRDKLTATAFIADQTPSPEGAYWTTFLHQDTPVFKGTEKLATKLNYPVVYASVKRTKRGVYTVDMEVLVENPKACVENEISEKHTRKLEKDIIAQPEIWLWTHRRWKHKR